MHTDPSVVDNLCSPLTKLFIVLRRLTFNYIAENRNTYAGLFNDVSGHATRPISSIIRTRSRSDMPNPPYPSGCHTYNTHIGKTVP